MKCLQTVEVNFEDIVANTPGGFRPLFQIIYLRILHGSQLEERVDGEYVYATKKGKFFNIVTSLPLSYTPAGVQFIKYVKIEK